MPSALYFTDFITVEVCASYNVNGVPLKVLPYATHINLVKHGSLDMRPHTAATVMTGSDFPVLSWHLESELTSFF